MICSRNFLSSALDKGKLSASSFGRFTPGEKSHCTDYMEGWVDPRGMAVVEGEKSKSQPGMRV
jgi:hypothetical protein